jgi:hypothetical protein
MTRRHFATTLGAAPAFSQAKNFFRLSSVSGRNVFLDPSGRPFFSLGLNHIDSAPLRYSESGDIWIRKYGGRTERWLKTQVRRDLLDWGFNCVGWTQDVVSRGETNHKHSRNFTPEEYEWLNLPYCHMLPFAEFHQWDAQNRQPDFFASEFEDWCDHVAREHCARLQFDKNLIGYFYVDCPTWVHTHPHSRWRGPIVDPATLGTESGRRELARIATRYYQTLRAAVRRYDKNHLILGDRYEGNGRMAEEVLQAAKPYVDVISFQHFGPVAKMKADLQMWADKTSLPVLLADAGRGKALPDKGYAHDPAEYESNCAALREIPQCVGFHLCGAYLKNRVRSKGLRDEREVADTRAIEGIRKSNLAMQAWLRGVTASGR